MKQSEIKFTVTLDENSLPTQIDWSASDTGTASATKAVMISLWDENTMSALRIDLWTKEMKVDEMKLFYHQSLVSMADTLERATGEKKGAEAMRKFAKDFGEKLGVLSNNKKS